MKKYTIVAEIETDGIDEFEIKDIIDLDLNRGRGIYLLVDEMKITPVDTNEDQSS